MAELHTGARALGDSCPTCAGCCVRGCRRCAGAGVSDSASPPCTDLTPVASDLRPLAPRVSRLLATRPRCWRPGAVRPGDLRVLHHMTSALSGGDAAGTGCGWCRCSTPERGRPDPSAGSTVAATPTPPPARPNATPGSARCTGAADACHPAWRGTPFQIGLVIILVGVAAAIPLFLKAQIATLLTPGESLTVHFPPTGSWTPTHRRQGGRRPGGQGDFGAADSGGGASVTVKISEDAYTALGSTPSSAIRPTTLLGGRLLRRPDPRRPARRPDGTSPGPAPGCPWSSSRWPLRCSPRPARWPARGGRLDDTLTAAVTGLRQLLATRRAPCPGGGRAGGAARRAPGTDLPDLVGNLESTVRVLTDRQGQLAGTVTDLAPSVGCWTACPDVAPR